MASDGVYSIKINATDGLGNAGETDILGSITLDNIPPELSIVSPENMTYGTASVPLEFAVSETTSWVAYSLDGGDNVTIDGNTTLSELSEGEHTLTVYANDTIGNMGSSQTIQFTIDLTLFRRLQIQAATTRTPPTPIAKIMYNVKKAKSVPCHNQ